MKRISVIVAMDNKHGIGKNNDLKTVSFRAGCITGPNHSGAKLHGFLSYLVKNTLLKAQILKSTF